MKEVHVREDNGGKRQRKTEHEVAQDIGDIDWVSAVPVGSTGGHHTLQLVTAPSKQWWRVPYEGPDPGKDHACQGMFGLEHHCT